MTQQPTDNLVPEVVLEPIQTGSKKQKFKRPVTPESIRSGTALAIAFLLMAVFIYFNPNYLGNPIASIIVSVVLASLGVTGLSIELKFRFMVLLDQKSRYIHTTMQVQ